MPSACDQKAILWCWLTAGKLAESEKRDPAEHSSGRAMAGGGVMSEDAGDQLDPALDWAQSPHKLLH